jgi:hypothetical protein
MSDDNLREVHRQLRLSQDKYSYFLLAVAGAAVGLAINQTHGTAIAWSQIPLAIAVLCWGLSFFFGCQQLRYVSSSLYANVALLNIQTGKHPEYNSNPQIAAAAIEGIRMAFESNSDNANKLGHWQFRFLIIGALFYIGWHVWEMALRTPLLINKINL